MRQVSRPAVFLHFASLTIAVAAPPLLIGWGAPEPVAILELASVLGFGVWLVLASTVKEGFRSAWCADAPVLTHANAPAGERSTIAALCLGWLIAGVFSACIGIVQYGWPAWGREAGLPGFIATPSVPGRAVGNVRQPNQLTTVLALAVCGAVWWAQVRAWPRWQVVPLVGLLVCAMVLSGSRMGWLMIALLAAWGALDRGLRMPVRVALVAAVPGALVFTLGAWAWGHLGGVTYFAEARLHSASDISSSRFAIWSNTWALIAAHPWTGVGWGRFNFAWTLTPFPDRPVAFFDHTHNLVLQLAVELGLPTAAVLIAGAAWALWRARGGCVAAEPSRRLAARVSAMMLALVGLHSLLEYPLWYAYFLLPTLVAAAVYLHAGRSAAGTTQRAAPSAAAGGPPAWRGAVAAVAARGVGLAMMAGALHAAWEYERVAQIFSPQGDAGARPLAERIRDGQRSVWFGHHADYAAVTTAAQPGALLDRFGRPLHHLIDARLMIAYARALHEVGEERRALYVAQRLREFRHPLGQEWFSACAAPPVPWQCETTPVTEYGFEDLEPGAVLAARRKAAR